MHVTAKNLAVRLTLAVQKGAPKPDIAARAAIKRALLKKRDRPELPEPALR
jgi:hypothetical protein